MLFIFPKNYNFKPKLLGLIEDTTAIFDVITALIIYFLINLFISDISIKITIFISIYLPIMLISIIGINKESFISITKYMVKFLINQNIYLYYK